MPPVPRGPHLDYSGRATPPAAAAPRSRRRRGSHVRAGSMRARVRDAQDAGPCEWSTRRGSAPCTPGCATQHSGASELLCARVPVANLGERPLLSLRDPREGLLQFCELCTVRCWQLASSAVEGEIILAVVVVTALGFDFTNGFHDTANAMATTIATGALSPKMAVTVAAILNFVGAFISLKVAATVAGGIVDAGAITPDGRVRRPDRRDLLEPGDVVVRPAVVVVARADRWIDRRHVGGGGSGRGRGRGDHVQGGRPGVAVAAARRCDRGGRRVARVPDDPALRRSSGPSGGSAGGRSPRRRWSRWRTAPTTRRRRWA